MLTVRNLTRQALGQQMLGPLDLDLEAGRPVVLGGPSGAGKSLLLRAIADLDPNKGEISLAGRSRQSMSAPEWRRKVTYLAAEPGWWAERVGDHFEGPSLDAAGKLLPRLGFAAETLNWPITGLSTGERQRLALIRLLVLAPAVMLLDEPTSALDEENRLRVEELIGERCAAGASALIVSHDGKQAARLKARRLSLLGGIIQEGGHADCPGDGP